MTFLKTKHPYVIMAFALPMLFIMCREREKQAERENLDTQISTLDNKISNTRNLRTAPMPQNLQNTQARYNSATDSLDKQADTIGICMMQNEDLLLFAFNNYAVRIGRDFQMSKFLPATDIATFQKHIAKIDSMDYIVDMARARILSGNGSLNDLSYFLELLDFDSVNTGLENKLAWDFYIDTNMTNDESVEVTTLVFDNPELNNVLRNEKNLLNHAWRKNVMQSGLNKSDSLYSAHLMPAPDSGRQEHINAKYDSLQNQIISEYENIDKYMPNFDIPEFDSVRAQYMHNDSIIQAYNKTFDNMLNAEDTLIQYRQNMMRKRDSLIEERKNLDR